MRNGPTTHVNGTSNGIGNALSNAWKRLPSLAESAAFLRWVAISYALLCLSIIGYTLLDSLIKLVMEAFGLIPLDMLYVAQTGPSTYGLFVLFVRSFAFWTVVQGCNYVYRLIYPSSSTVTLDSRQQQQQPENAKLFQ